MYIVVLFIIDKNWEQHKYSLGGEWLNKLCYIYMMEYYLEKTRMNYWYVNNMDISQTHYAKWRKPASKI